MDWYATGTAVGTFVIGFYSATRYAQSRDNPKGLDSGAEGETLSAQELMIALRKIDESLGKLGKRSGELQVSVSHMRESLTGDRAGDAEFRKALLRELSAMRDQQTELLQLLAKLLTK